MKFEYPIGFPPDCQNVVEAEKIRADKNFQVTEPTQTLEQRALVWVCRLLGAFAHQACGLAERRHWTLSQVGSAVDQFCLELVRKANYLMSDGRLQWVERVFGMSIRPDVRRAIENSVEWGHHCDELLQITELLNSRAGSRTAIDTSLLKWEDIELRFLSDERVQIFIRGAPASSVNFADLGFEDRRGKGGKPSAAWRMLRDLPMSDGKVPARSIQGNQQLQKRAQEIRRLLGKHFRLTDNPLPFFDGIGYRTRFKITRSPSHTT